MEGKESKFVQAILAVVVVLTLVATAAVAAYAMGSRHRAIHVDPKPVAVSGKVVYLTFDDGRTPGYTNEVLADLEAAGAHATFFEIGQHMVGNQALIASLIKDGNVIGDHSWSHPSFWALTPAQAYKQIERPVSWLRNNLGYKVNLFRYPYGISTRAGDTALWALGLRPDWWNIETSDWKPDVSTAAIINHVMDNVRPGCIIGLHDGAVGTITFDNGHQPNYLPTLLAKLKAAGYSFGTLKATQTSPSSVTGSE